MIGIITRTYFFPPEVIWRPSWYSFVGKVLFEDGEETESCWNHTDLRREMDFYGHSETMESSRKRNSFFFFFFFQECRADVGEFFGFMCKVGMKRKLQCISEWDGFSNEGKNVRWDLNLSIRNWLECFRLLIANVSCEWQVAGGEGWKLIWLLDNRIGQPSLLTMCTSVQCRCEGTCFWFKDYKGTFLKKWCAQMNNF